MKQIKYLYMITLLTGMSLYCPDIDENDPIDDQLTIKHNESLNKQNEKLAWYKSKTLIKNAAIQKIQNDAKNPNSTGNINFTNDEKIVLNNLLKKEQQDIVNNWLAEHKLTLSRSLNTETMNHKIRVENQNFTDKKNRVPNNLHENNIKGLKDFQLGNKSNINKQHSEKTDNFINTLNQAGIHIERTNNPSSNKWIDDTLSNESKNDDSNEPLRQEILAEQAREQFEAQAKIEAEKRAKQADQDYKNLRKEFIDSSKPQDNSPIPSDKPEQPAYPKPELPKEIQSFVQSLNSFQTPIAIETVTKNLEDALKELPARTLRDLLSEEIVIPSAQRSKGENILITTIIKIQDESSQEIS